MGGVLIRAGDFIVADGDGVITVPAEHIETVAELAAEERANDLVSRRRLYTKLGMTEDDTLR